MDGDYKELLAASLAMILKFIVYSFWFLVKYKDKEKSVGYSGWDCHDLLSANLAMTGGQLGCRVWDCHTCP